MLSGWDTALAGTSLWLPAALTAALLTSFLPIINKQLLREVEVTVVAWGVNLLSLPLLAVAAFVLLPIPTVDAVFWLAIGASALLNLGATLLTTQAWKVADASLVTPFLTFNPPFSLLVGWFVLGETPGPPGIAGVALVLVGSYVMTATDLRRGWWRPFAAMVQQPGINFAIVASFLWGLTPVTEKIAMLHAAPGNPPAVAFGSTALMVIGLTLPLLFRPGTGTQIRRHWQGFGLAAAIAGIAPVFGFTAIASGLVGYVSAIFKLSTVLTVIWAGLLLKESEQRTRLAGAAVMVAGALLVSVG
jgi:drug/metabolite transporter (DMT)-like permease